MKIKALGLIWDFKPALIALWMFSGLFIGLTGLILLAQKETALGLLLMAFAAAWFFITFTIEQNKKELQND